jgi:hypothetical protein
MTHLTHSKIIHRMDVWRLEVAYHTDITEQRIRR